MEYINAMWKTVEVHPDRYNDRVKWDDLHKQTTKKPLTCRSLTIMVGVAQGPGFIRVEMRVSSDPRPGKVGVSQKASLSIKRRAVAVETGCEDDSDVYVALTALQGAVGDSLEVQRCNALPHIECPPDGFVSLPRAHLRGHVLYTGGETGCIRHDYAWNLSFLYLLCKASAEYYVFRLLEETAALLLGILPHSNTYVTCPCV